MTQNNEAPKTRNYVFQNIDRFVKDRYDLRYNVVKLGIEGRERGKPIYRNMKDRDMDKILANMIEENLFKFKQRDFELYTSAYIEDFDPYISYFESLPPWNGEDHIKKLSSYIKVEESEHYNFCVQLKKWLVRVIKCMLEENYYNKQILVFVQDEQNTGKTFFCRWLCPPALADYYSEEIAKGKDESIQLASNFLILFDEMMKLNHAGVEEIKTTLSKLKIKFRPPYAKREEVFSRRCSFIGNTNQKQFLLDETGSVRFLCFTLKSIDFAYSREININDIYAQAYYLYRTGYICDMTPEELTALKEYNKQFFVTTTEHDLILEYIRPATDEDIQNETTPVYYWQAGQILQYIQDLNSAIKLNPVSLGKALKFLGFQRVQKRDKKIVKYTYPVCVLHDMLYMREHLKYCK